MIDNERDSDNEWSSEINSEHRFGSESGSEFGSELGGNDIEENLEKPSVIAIDLLTDCLEHFELPPELIRMIASYLPVKTCSHCGILHPLKVGDPDWQNHSYQLIVCTYCKSLCGKKKHFAICAGTCEKPKQWRCFGCSGEPYKIGICHVGRQLWFKRETPICSTCDKLVCYGCSGDRHCPYLVCPSTICSEECANKLKQTECPTCGDAFCSNDDCEQHGMVYSCTVCDARVCDGCSCGDRYVVCGYCKKHYMNK